MGLISSPSQSQTRGGAPAAHNIISYPGKETAPQKVGNLTTPLIQSLYKATPTERVQLSALVHKLVYTVQLANLAWSSVLGVSISAPLLSPVFAGSA